MADPNVLVAAAITPRGLCARLLEAATGVRWQLVVSPQVVAELGEVLAREEFRRWLSEEEARRFTAVVTPGRDERPNELDPPVDHERNYVHGPVDASVELVEHGDFECPFCSQATGVLKEVRAEPGDRVRCVCPAHC